MKWTKRGFPAEVVAAIDKAKFMAIRAGTKKHRFIGIWAVVVEGRVFVRSWSIKPRSWYRTFLVEPRGMVQVGAYLAKYDTPGSIATRATWAAPNPAPRPPSWCPWNGVEPLGHAARVDPAGPRSS